MLPAEGLGPVVSIPTPGWQGMNAPWRLGGHRAQGRESQRGHFPGLFCDLPTSGKLPLFWGGSWEKRKKLTFREHLLGARRDDIQSP